MKLVGSIPGFFSIKVIAAIFEGCRYSFSGERGVDGEEIRGARDGSQTFTTTVGREIPLTGFWSGLTNEI